MGFYDYSEDDIDISSNSHPKAAENGSFNLIDFADSPAFDDAYDSGGNMGKHRKTRKWYKFSGLAKGLTFFWIAIALLVGLLATYAVAALGFHYIIPYRWALCGFVAITLLVIWICYLFLPLNHRKAQKVVSCVLSVLLACCIAVTTITPLWKKADEYLSKWIMGGAYNPLNLSDDDLGITGEFDENILNVALFGIDTRDPKVLKGRSDSIMILSLNPKKHTVKIVSVVRDSLVPIEGHGYGKINSAYSYGGPELAISTLNKTFNLNIRNYATVNFYGMAEIIDAVGGIDIELTEGEVQTAAQDTGCINGCIGEICGHLGKNPKNYYIFESGKHHVNGIQAVAYSRIRHVANIWGNNNWGDYGRTQRQRYVMEQLFNKATKMNSSQYAKLVNKLLPYVETSLSADKIISMANSVLLKSPTFEKGNIPIIDREEYDYATYGPMRMTAPTSQYGSVEYYDIDFAADMINAFFFKDITFRDYIDKNGVGTNDWYSQRMGWSSSQSGGTKSSSGSKSSSKTNNNTSRSDTSEFDTSSSVYVGDDTSDITSSVDDTSDIDTSENTSSTDASSTESSSSGGTSSTESSSSGGTSSTESSSSGTVSEDTTNN